MIWEVRIKSPLPFSPHSLNGAPVDLLHTTGSNDIPYVTEKITPQSLDIVHTPPSRFLKIWRRQDNTEFHPRGEVDP